MKSEQNAENAKLVSKASSDPLTVERARAERLAMEKKDLLATMSHDLQNPLAAIKLNLSILARMNGEKFERSGHAVIAKIANSTHRMERLILDLLDIAEIEAGTFRIERTRQKVDAILKETVYGFQAIAASRGIRLEAQPGFGLFQVECDHHRILQVLSSLVENALKFTPSGGEVILGVLKSDSELIFRIRDSAPAIAPDVIPHLFDRFSQSPSTQRLGTGLGLAIAHGIIRAHQGRMWVESDPNHGNSFFFTLPLSS